MLVLGDAHADRPDNREALMAAYRAADLNLALQLGDLLHYDLPVQTYFIAGNNEDFDVIEALRFGRVRSSGVRNLRLLASTVVEVEGRRVAGLSGNYAPTQFEKPRSALVGPRRRHFVREDVERAKSLSDVDVFLAHEAPHGTAVAEDYSVGCTYIDEILEAIEPELCLVGHHHQHSESTFGPTRVVTLDPAWESYYLLDPETLELTRHETPESRGNLGPTGRDDPVG
jgi:Icc-related predicted phosphoesterase